ncbi:MAG TPA: uroporphyrinogen decarboxylase family protein [Candidatus Hydrogenedentes bacterium]|nr:uroporphyrinogen decarboxylase family protein [Candidatus Hydrogenedentota bacterium]HPG65250.1 uroporphyrinogen decarboxylase family protein [Candidatus Hydrogenedentota bacterium]
MTARERVLTALAHCEPDRVPYDLCGTHVTAISRGAYDNLRRYLGLAPERPRWLDVLQQAVIPADDILERLTVDTRGVFPLTSHNWNVFEQLEDGGENWVYHDEWGMTQHFPKENGLWFTIVAEPLADAPPDPASVDGHAWPDAANRARIAGLREQALAFRESGYCVMLKGLCAGVFEMSQRIRGMQNALLDPMLYPEFSDKLLGKIADLKIAFWEMALAELGDVVDVVVENDDYGTQQSQLISHDQYCSSIKHHQVRLFSAIKAAAPDAALFFHSCGNVRPFLPDFIEAGVDILNPVHVSAAGMEPVALKRDFGDALTFWGGGVETQHVLPTGTPEQIREDVKRNIEALAPGGGYVFNTVHNIQSEVPPENIMAMWEALQEFGMY